jgi:hypothetical protein
MCCMHTGLRRALLAPDDDHHGPGMQPAPAPTDTPGAFAAVSFAFGGESECSGVLNHPAIGAPLFQVCTGTVALFNSNLANSGLAWSPPAGFSGTSLIAEMCASTCAS